MEATRRDRLLGGSLAQGSLFKRPVLGFTLVELLVVIAIAGVLLGFMVPSMMQAIRRAKIMGTAQATTQLLQVARLNAIKQFRRTIVQIDPPGAEPGAPTENPVAIVKAFVDRNANAAPDGTELLAAVEIPDELTYSVVGFSPDPRDPNLPRTAVFNPDGTMLADGALPGAFFGAFRFEDARENELETRVLSPPTNFKVRILKKDKETGQWLTQGLGATPWEWY
ncbi:MAG TPA: GspH/FimT family pseudopilin [Thermoanaerobaculia bacterium]|nr:GspH/FimT family pseudopilin [Thermoanaerobaculia bacterium]